MAKRAKLTEPVAMSRIEFGEVVDGKNVVKTFEPGDVVTLDRETLKRLKASGAVKQLEEEGPADKAD